MQLVHCTRSVLSQLLVLLLVLWWIPNHVDLSMSFESYDQHTVSGAIAANTVGKQDVHCAALSIGGGWMLSWFLEEAGHGHLPLASSLGLPVCSLMGLCVS